MKKILVFHESRGIREAVSDFFRNGFEIIKVNSSEAALKKLDKCTDIILIFCQGCSRDFIQRARGNVRYKKTIIVALSVSRSPAIIESLFKWGANDVVFEPFEFLNESFQEELKAVAKKFGLVP